MKNTCLNGMINWLVIFLSPLRGWLYLQLLSYNHCTLSGFIKNEVDSHPNPTESGPVFREASFNHLLMNE
jgi:hypothetical protein